MATKDPKKVAAGRKGGLANVERNGAEWMRQIGQQGGAKGGRTTLQRHGKDHFRRIGRLGGAAPKRA